MQILIKRLQPQVDTCCHRCRFLMIVNQRDLLSTHEKGYERHKPYGGNDDVQVYAEYKHPDFQVI